MHKVIFDTDPGVDDAMALLFLHNHPEIDLIGITTVFGNASVEGLFKYVSFLLYGVYALFMVLALGSFGEANDIAEAVGFLASKAARYVTGETLHVNGGMYMP